MITAMSFSISSFDSSPALHDNSSAMQRLPSGNIDLSLLAYSSGKTTTNTLDRSQGIDNLLLSIDVSVKNTKNVLELSLVDKRLRTSKRGTLEGNEPPTMLLLHFFAPRVFHKT